MVTVLRLLAEEFNCNCPDLLHRVMESWTIDSFYNFSMLNNNFKEVMNCKIVIGKLLQ